MKFIWLNLNVLKYLTDLILEKYGYEALCLQKPVAIQNITLLGRTEG